MNEIMLKEALELSKKAIKKIQEQENQIQKLLKIIEKQGNDVESTSLWSCFSTVCDHFHNESPVILQVIGSDDSIFTQPNSGLGGTLFRFAKKSETPSNRMTLRPP